MDEEQETHSLNMMLEVYLRDRDDPIMWPMRMDINRKITKVAQVMDYAYAHINSILDSRSEDHVLVVDGLYNHHLVFRTDLQVMSILAPDQSSIPWGDDEDEV